MYRVRHWKTSLEDASDISEVIDGSNSSDDDINNQEVKIVSLIFEFEFR